MAVIPEIPILTPRILNLLIEIIPPDKHRLLRGRLERIKPFFGSFLTQHDGDAHEVFLIASSRYTYPRSEAVSLLLSIIGPLQFTKLVRATADFATDMLRLEGWRLGDGVQPLRNAWETYAQIGELLTQNVAALIQATSLPYGWLMASTKMDFSLTATALYLEGEFPDASAARLGYLCQAAESEAANAKRILMQALFPSATTKEKSTTLRHLFGSWQGDDSLDEDRKGLYKSRLYRSSEPS